MADRRHWFSKKKAPYAGREKQKPRVLNEDLLNLPLGEDPPQEDRDPEELSEEVKGFLHRLFSKRKTH